jgi:hypothetical protein
MMPIIIYAYLAELILNRTLFRVEVFMPPGPLLNALRVATSIGGLAALNFTVLASSASLLALAVQRRRVSVFSAAILAAVVLDHLGVVKAYWGLVVLSVALLLHAGARRAVEAALFILMPLASATGLAAAVRIAHYAWLAAPLPHLLRQEATSTAKIWRRVTISAPVTGALLAAIHANPYIAGSVLAFAMGLLNPWYLPAAVMLYTAAPTSEALSLLLTGPQLQLSNQVLVLSAVYLASISRVGKGA